MSTPPQSPAPESPGPSAPPGPGVVVPFAAPPRDQDKTRTVIWIVVGVVAAVLACGGLVGGFGAVAVWTSNEITSKAEATADNFMTMVMNEDYPDAYQSLCEDKRAEIDEETFATSWQRLEMVRYTIDMVRDNGEGNLVAPVTIARAAGGDLELPLVIEMEPGSLNMAVCDW